MKVVEALSELRAVCAGLPRPLGLVPTMGYLHEGHLSLVKEAQARAASVGVSIFVNPTQFGPDDDFDSYPRDRERDLGLLRAAGVDVVWTPTQDALYPAGFQTWVEVEQVSQPLEGAQRPGHFRGVTTVVSKLFHAFQPDLAFFGQKDAQQVVVIGRMLRDLNFPLSLVVCPIVREPDGLALSSRNSYLNSAERQAATVLYRALSAAAQEFEHGQRRAGRLRRAMAEVLAEEPLADLEYVSLADPATLEERHGQIKGGLLSLAVNVGKTRLIDNMLLGEAELGVGAAEVDDAAGS